MRRRAPKSTVHLLNSDENILKILALSNEYLEQHMESIAAPIEEIVWIFRSLNDLVPETLDNFGSGHIFPLCEALYEMESSIEFCKLGYYKHAIAALRNVLELGLLSVYYDIDGRSHVTIRNWLCSCEPTPFKKAVFATLRKHHNIGVFDVQHHIFDDIASLYERLCNYSHTRGVHFSSRGLSNSNINTFNEKSLKKWFDLMNRVVKSVVALHVLKYPIALQFTPIDSKFGLNGPIGGFLQPFQSDRIRNLFDKSTLETLQQISNSDTDAVEIAHWVNAKPDITEEDFMKQIEAQDRSWIEMQGYSKWLSNEKRMSKLFKENSPESYAQKSEYFKSMRKWAKDHGYLKPKLPTEARNR